MAESTKEWKRAPLGLGAVVNAAAACSKERQPAPLRPQQERPGQSQLLVLKVDGLMFDWGVTACASQNLRS